MTDDLPPPHSLGPGTHVIALPLPFPSPSWVNTYVLESEDQGLTLIDCGCDWEQGNEALRAGLAALDLESVPVRTLLVTHLHPDHVGMADRLRAETGARLVMHSRAEARMARYNDTAGFVERNRALAVRHGVPRSLVPGIAGNPERPDFMPPLSPPDVLVDDGDAIELGESRHLQVLHTPGHEASHICLRDPSTGAVFSGDHILPRISPVIMYDEDHDDVLGDYMASLRRLLQMPIGLTYPAHGGPITRGAARAHQLLLHHHRRLDQMRDRAVDAPATAWDMVEAVFRPHLSPEHQRLALRETIAHLEHLRLDGRLRRQDSDGVVRYLL
ncbi:MAG: MBL fold metallo-hydrolase [Actinomycetota bacterium]